MFEVFFHVIYFLIKSLLWPIKSTYGVMLLLQWTVVGFMYKGKELTIPLSRNNYRKGYLTI